MCTKTVISLFLLGFLLVLLPMSAVAADTGPKPTMDFEFTQEFSGNPVTITGGNLFECEQSDCSDAEPLMEAGPQRFTCTINSCHALAYGFRNYHHLEIVFSDEKTRQSNIFKTDSFSGKYKVIIREDDLLVESQFSLASFSETTYSILCGCCLLVLAIMVGIVWRVKKK
jgi:hypothetical protein